LGLNKFNLNISKAQISFKNFKQNEIF